MYCWVKSFEKKYKMPVDEFYDKLKIFLKKPIYQQIKLLTK